MKKTSFLDNQQLGISFETKDLPSVNPLNSIGTQHDVYEQVNQQFQEQSEKQKTIQETRDILGEAAENLTDDQVHALTTEIQYLVDTWIEEYEQKIFDGKTLKELLQINI